MYIATPSLRHALVRVKAAAIADTIRKAGKGQFSEEIKPEPVPMDVIGSTVKPKPNSDETDVESPTQHNLPTDPEYNTPSVVTGTGNGPIMGKSNEYL